LKDPPKFTQIGIFGLKKCHLATLLQKRFFPHGAALHVVFSEPSNMQNNAQLGH
jgi:hypothetical protein